MLDVVEVFRFQIEHVEGVTQRMKSNPKPGRKLEVPSERTPNVRIGEFREDEIRVNWDRSSKAGTVTGAGMGAAVGAAMGSAGGLIGVIIGTIAGLAIGAAVGAAGDAAAYEIWK